MDEAAKTERMEAYRRICRDQGLRVTVQKRAILEAVLDLDNHPTRRPGLRVGHPSCPGHFADHRLPHPRGLRAVIGVDHQGLPPGRSTRYDPRVELHHHLICLHCDAVIDITDTGLDALGIPDTSDHGFEVRDFRVQLRGICRRCQETGSKGEIKMRKPLFALLLAVGLLGTIAVFRRRRDRELAPTWSAAGAHPRRQPANRSEDRSRRPTLPRCPLQHHGRCQLRHLPRQQKGLHRQPAQGLGGQQQAHRNPERADRDQRRLLHLSVLGRAIAIARGPGPPSADQPGRDGSAEPPADSRYRALGPGVQGGVQRCLRRDRRRDHHGRGDPGDRRVRAHPGIRQLSVRPLSVRRSAGRHGRAAEARFRALRQPGPVRLLSRGRGDSGAVHR